MANITEMNKVISEFMGDHVIEQNDCGTKKFLRFDSINHRGYTETKYHESYDWLMPVWVRFRDLEFDINCQPRIHHAMFCQGLNHAIGYESISVAHHKIYNAIQWYNSLTQKQK